MFSDYFISPFYMFYSILCRKLDLSVIYLTDVLEHQNIFLLFITGTIQHIIGYNKISHWCKYIESILCSKNNIDIVMGKISFSTIWRELRTHSQTIVLITYMILCVLSCDTSQTNIGFYKGCDKYFILCSRHPRDT